MPAIYKQKNVYFFRVDQTPCQITCSLKYRIWEIYPRAPLLVPSCALKMSIFYHSLGFTLSQLVSKLGKLNFI